MTENKSGQMQASFSVLMMSIASSALMSLGLSPQDDGSIQKDKNLARFNIDLLITLQEKTKGNLSAEEDKFLKDLIQDLQTKFLL